MGQYYYPIITKIGQKRNTNKRFYSHEYDHNGLKLMEHSYITNIFVETVLNELYMKRGLHLAWVGDYSDLQEDLLEDKDPKLFESMILARRSDRYSHPAEYHGSHRYYINHTKKEILDLESYKNVNGFNDYWGDCYIHPIPLLTAIGNGKGGGDYSGINEELVGIWATDEIEARDDLLPDYLDKYNDISTEIIFKEE